MSDITFDALRELPVLILDGATGTGLMAAGMPRGVCVERWVLEHPQVLIDWQKQYLAAGSRLLLTPTFGANRARLALFGEQDNVAELNRRLAALTVEAADGKALVAGDVSPTGLFCEPFGDASFEELVAIYAEQIAALKEAGVDLIFAETMMSLGDVRAAVVAARDAGLPVIASVTMDGGSRTLSGMTPEAAVLCLQAAGADAVGLNCSTGVEDMAALLPGMRQVARVPLAAKPNAGTPEAPLPPESFGPLCAAMAAEGALLLGGCCQSSPAHIAALTDALKKAAGTAADAVSPAAAALPALLQTLCGGATESLSAAKKAVPDLTGLPLCFENRIFPDTADGEAGLALSEPLACDADLEDALLDADDGDAQAALIRIRPGDDVRCIARSCFMSPLPVALCCTDDSLLESALRIFPGRAAVLCQSAAQRKIALRWGAMLLPD